MPPAPGLRRRRRIAAPARRPPPRPRREQVRLISAKEWMEIAAPIINFEGRGIGSSSFNRRFKSTFGIPPKVVATAWKLIARKGFLNHLGPRSLKPIHLLWTLMFMKGYAIEADHAGRVKCDEKTFRKWTWFYTKCLADLDTDVIKWENRFKGDTGNRCLVTIDGTDFRIGEPVPFSKCWYSQKFHGPGVRYELAVCIATGDIVAFNGPFAPKKAPDITIFRWGLKRMLGSGEQAMADKGYRGDLGCCTPFNSKNRHHRRAMSLARCRHETINRRLKVWKALKTGWRHHRSKHHLAFRCAVVLTQLYFQAGYGPWQVKDITYSDPVWVGLMELPEGAVENDPLAQLVGFSKKVSIRHYRY